MKKPTLLLLLLTSVHLTSCSNIEVRPESEEMSNDCRSTDSLYAISKDELYSSLSLQSLTLDLQRQQTGVGKESPSLWHRIRKGYGLKVEDNDRIQEAVAKFTRSPSYFEMISTRANPYLYHIVEELERRGLPLELALLPAIESAYKPTARSHKSAVGLWQFIPSTGRTYGLEQNDWYDGRRDIVASTSAALDYLEKLYVDFNGDWLKAIGAYNCGEGCMQRAVTRNEERGLPTDFWSLSLPRETEEYVPSLLAVSKVIGSPELYGVQLAEVPNKAYLKQIDVGRQIDLSLAAELAGISQEEFKLLNAGHRRQVTAPQGPHCVTLPVERIAEFKQRLADSGLGDFSYTDSPSSRPSLTAETMVNRPVRMMAMNSTENVTSPRITEKPTFAQEVVKNSQPLSQTTTLAKAENGATPRAVEKRTFAQEVVERSQPLPQVTTLAKVENGATPRAVEKRTFAQEMAERSQPLPQVPQVTTLAKVENGATPRAVEKRTFAQEMAERSHPLPQVTTLAKVENEATPRAVEKRTFAQEMAESALLAQVEQATVATVTLVEEQNSAPPAKVAKPSQRVAQAALVQQRVKEKKARAEKKVMKTEKRVQTRATAKLEKPTKSPVADAAEKTQTHQVQKGETLVKLANRYNTTVVKLRKLNKLESQSLQKGQKLQVPLSSVSPDKNRKKVDKVAIVTPSTQIKVTAQAKGTPSAQAKSESHQVKAGETLWRIAKRYSVSVEELRKLNKLAQPIRAGQELTVPSDKRVTPKTGTKPASREKPA